MRVRAFIAAAIIASLAGPSCPTKARCSDTAKRTRTRPAGEMQQEKEAERAYQRSLGNVPDKGPVDPWGNARSVEAPKGEAKAAKADAKAVPAKPKTKTGETAK